MNDRDRPTLLVLSSTYPRWAGDPEPAFVHELCRRLVSAFDVIALVPDAPGADASADACVRGVFEPAIKDLTTLKDPFAAKVTVTIK